MTEENTVRFATLDDLSSRNVNVLLQIGEKPVLDADGRPVLDENGLPTKEPIEVRFPLRTLSFYKVQEIINSVATPLPTQIHDIQKLPGGGIRRVYDYDDPNYQGALAMAMHERNIRIILAAWREDELPIPGETTDEKLVWLKEHVEVGIMRQLISVLTNLSAEGEARVEARALSF